ncbi:MAG: acyl-CoA dehydrogenase family protein [Myxococcota bacterium]
MNSLFLAEEHEMLREQVRRFVDEEIKPYGDGWEEAEQVPREVLRKMGSLGFFGIRYPETFGGAEMDTRATVVWAEELGRSTFSGAAITALVHTDMASIHLFHSGTPEQMERYMPGIVSGDTLTAIAITEPNAGSDVKGIRTHARRDGDHYILNGSKIFITNGVNADLFFVVTKTDLEAPASRGMTVFMVEKDTPGFSVSRRLDKHGWRCSDTAELAFEDCRVPAANILGELGQGFYSLMQNLQNERLVIGAMAMGEAQAAIDMTVDNLKNRIAFGAPLWEKQGIRQRMAMLQAKVTAGRQLIYATAHRDAQGENVVKEVSMIKAYCGELVNEVLYDCVQFHGGMGYMRETPIERMSRDVRVQSIGGGATEVMLEEVAKRM